jgi:hypothetical protein
VKADAANNAMVNDATKLRNMAPFPFISPKQWSQTGAISNLAHHFVKNAGQAGAN